MHDINKQLAKAQSIVECFGLHQLMKWEVDDYEYMVPALEVVCDLPKDAAEALEGLRPREQVG